MGNIISLHNNELPFVPEKTAAWAVCWAKKFCHIEDKDRDLSQVYGSPYGVFHEASRVRQSESIETGSNAVLVI